MKKVITYGSFDLFHEGHYSLLKRAKALGDYLYVGVTTEQYDNQRGKMNVVDTLMERIENVKRTGFADEIIIEDHEGQKLSDIQKYSIDVFTVGSDWRGAFDYLNEYCEVVYLERTKGVSSTIIRNDEQRIIKLGAIGTGRIASRFSPEVKHVSGISLNGVYNHRLENAKKYAERFELGFYTDSMDEFLSKVDAVYIATPHETHYEYAKRAILAGRHVLCEKPMVYRESEARELFRLAGEQNTVLMEAVKTAYVPGFINLLAIAKGGRIGEIRDVEACFTSLKTQRGREFTGEAAGSFLEMGSYPLTGIIKLLGRDFLNVRFETFLNKNGVDLYTKAYLTYPNRIATAKVGMGVKSEGQMVISGTQGYIVADAPWWLTQSFELRFEDPNNNEKFYTKFLNEGLRYEISDFVKQINRVGETSFKLSAEDSIVMAKIMEMFLKRENTVIIN